MDKKYRNPTIEENYHNLVQKTGQTIADFNLVEPEKVLEFISKHDFLKNLLVEAEEAIRVHFRNAALYLEVITDPDNSEDTQLVLSISPNSNPKIAIKKFDTFNNTWWFNTFDRGENKLAIMLEYR